MSYAKISDGLYITQQSVKNEKVVVTRGHVNHIWLYDRSGSMYGALSELTTQLKSLVTQIPKNDTISIGWFSGEGTFNFIIKGFKVSDDSDYSILEQAIDKNKTTIGTTCFSEILENTSVVIEDLSVFSKTFSLHMFTDGYPVVSNYKKEVDSIYSAIDKIKGKIDSAMLVGYGRYYNKELMVAMAEKMGAMLIHSSMIPEYANTIIRLIDLSGSVSPKQEILPPVKDIVASFIITEQGIVVSEVDRESGYLYVSPQGDRTSIYYVSYDEPTDDLMVTPDKIMEGMYASAYILTQQMKTNIALEIIGSIGDKRIIDAITNAFTIDEYGKTEHAIEQAIYKESMRFVNGRDVNYLPPDDAFCVFDVLSKLMDDDNASFYPYHEKFEYHKVSKPTVINEDYSKFTPEDNPSCAMNDLVWHEKRLNLSVRCVIRGTISLKDKNGVTASDMGFSDEYPVFVYRTYTFIKDGVVNVERFYVSTGKETYDFFKSHGIVVDDINEADGVYGLDISNLTAMNRSMAYGNTSAKTLCSLLKKSEELGGVLKSLKYYLKEEFDNESSVHTDLITEQQKEFLIANGVEPHKGGVYSPKSDAVDSIDKYVARTFDIKIKSMSSLPTVKSVLAKIDAKKSLTLSDSVVAVGINMYMDYKNSQPNEEMRKLWLNTEISKIKLEQKFLRNSIQKTKFAIILGRQWFDEFKSRDENVITFEDWVFTFVLGEEVVDI